jgi:alginate O-acetyltransferase complex protein AlgI
MLFNSAQFIFLFLPPTIALFYILSRIDPRVAQAWLCIASFIFYGYWSVPFLGLLFASILFNYTSGLLIDRLSTTRLAKSIVLSCAIAGNLLILGHYKYAPSLTGVQDIVLPLGISFFTFTQIGYLVDRAQSGRMEHNIIRYTLFVTFFPHLIAGPILHHKEMMPQFANPETFRWKAENISVGSALFIIGLSKKVLLADNMAPFADAGFQHPAQIGATTAWLAILCYSMQLYFDFSGYSDMAIGLSKMFGIRFPLNFNSPYKATSIIDFWQRWHMTLTRYLTLYLYSPVALLIARRRAGKGLAYGPSAARTLPGFLSTVAGPIVFTMALAGVWHGAGWQFLIYGLLHAFYLTVNHAWRTFGPKSSSSNGSTNGALWNVPLTFLAVSIGWIFFRANSLSDAFSMLEGFAVACPVILYRLACAKFTADNG